MNENRTCDDSDAKLTRPRSGPVRYEVVDKDGKVVRGPDGTRFYTAGGAAMWAMHLWPDQEQDEDRTGKGWDVQVAGCDQ